MRLDLTGKQRAGALRADGHGDGVAVDDGGSDEVGWLWLVNDVDQHAARSGGSRDGGVQRCAAGRGIGDEDAVEVA